MAERWARVPGRAGRDRSLTATTLRVLIGICIHSDPRGRSFPSLAAIAEHAGVDRRNVPSEITTLESRGYVKRIGWHSAKGQRSSRIYEVVYDDPTAPNDISPDVTLDDIHTGDIPPDVTNDIPPDVRGDISPDALTTHYNNPTEQPSVRVMNGRSFAQEHSKARPHRRQKGKEMGAAGTRLPPDWEPTPDLIAYCRRQGIDPSKAVEEFVNYWLTVPGKAGMKLDWGPAFKNRCMQLAERGQFLLC